MEAVADVVDDDSVAICGRADGDGALVCEAVADGAPTGRFPGRVDPGVGDVWRAINGHRPCWHDETVFGDSGGAFLTVPLDDSGLLVVFVTERDEELAPFIRAVGRQAAAALTQFEQQRSIQELSDDVGATQRRAERYQRLQGAVVDTVGSITEARSAEAVRSTVVSFGERLTEYTFAGEYHPVKTRVTPTEVSSPGGPAKLYDREEAYPATLAATENAVTVAADGRSNGHDGWVTELLYFGYRSSIAVPLSHRGTVHGVAEFVSTRAGLFEGPEREAIEAVCGAAGLRLAGFSEPNGDREPVLFDVECRDPPAIFPGLPQDGALAIEHVAALGVSDIVAVDEREPVGVLL